MQLPEIEPRNLYIIGDIDQKSLSDTLKGIIKINESDLKLEGLAKLNGFSYTPEPIKIYIESYGGDLTPTRGLIGLIEQSKTPVHTIAVGAVMSCGFMILISGHKRFCYEHSTPLYHQISTFPWGALKTVDENVKQSKKLQKWIEDYVLVKTKMTKKQLKKFYKCKKDFYMSSKKALKLGVVDEIIKK